MGGCKDLTGKRFGRLIVIERVGKDRRNNATWRCLCECGNECIVTTCNLNRGSTKSCGCLAKELSSERALDNLIGQRFGKLVVVKRAENRGKEVCWECKCDCGNIHIARANDLKKGNTKSCGCLYKNDLKGKRFERLTVIEEYGRNKYDEVLWTCQCDCGNKSIVRGTDLIQNKVKSCGCLRKELMYGENNRNYNPDLTDEDRQDRRLVEGYKEWAYKIKEQANFICDCCGEQNGVHHSHHLESYNSNKELRLDLNNGVCLCEKCHKEFHKLYGYGNNTKQQYIEFKKKIGG